MTYAAQLTITSNTAIDTAAICYRKARRDVHRIHAMLIHPRTVHAAKIAIWCLYLGVVVAFTLGQTARILVDTGAKAIQRWAEAEVQSCIQSDVDHIPDAGDMVESDPFAPDTNPHHATVAATIAAPVATLTIPTASEYHGMTTVELRKECQAQGIKWRNAHGTRHLSKGEMIDALS